MNITATADWMATKYATPLICRPEYDLVIEGYPRSANSMTVDLIDLLVARGGPPQPNGKPARLYIGHHTHVVENLQLAQAYGVPMLVLIRRPLDAVLSYHIFSQLDVARCIRGYIAFYRGVLALDAPFVLVRFEEAVRDFNGVLTRLNPLLSKPVPLSPDLAADIAVVQASARARALNAHGQNAVRKAGLPDAARDVIKADMRADVARAVADASEMDALYDAVCARGV